MDTANTPRATWMYTPTRPLEAESTARITESVNSRRKRTTPSAAPTPAAMPPDQKASRLSMGRGREIRSAVIPIRTGSIAASMDSRRTALDIDAYFGTNVAAPTAEPLRRRLSDVVADISIVSLVRRSLSVQLAAIRIGCQHYSLRNTGWHPPLMGASTTDTQLFVENNVRRPDTHSAHGGRENDGKDLGLYLAGARPSVPIQRAA